jgi:hypothetical protein
VKYRTKTFLQKCASIAALFVLAYMLLNAFEYRNALTTVGTVTQVGQKICLYYRDESSHIGCDRIAVKMAYKDGEIDREVDVKYGTSSRFARYDVRLHPAAVGAQAQVVYVPGRPWLTQLAVNHNRGWALVWLVCLLALFAWMVWRGDEHPLVAWFNSYRRDIRA